MTPAEPASNDVLATVDALGPPGTPVTMPEVAEGFDCPQRTISDRLDALVEAGTLLTKPVGANSRVWWHPVDAALRPTSDGSVPSGPVSLRDEQPHPPTMDPDVAERIREFDWAETPLGPVEEWSPTLLAAVDIVLGAERDADSPDRASLETAVGSDALGRLVTSLRRSAPRDGESRVEFTVDGVRVEVPSSRVVRRGRQPAEGTRREMSTEEEFQAALSRIIREAEANGVAVDGGWECLDESADPEWGIEIYEVVSPY